MENLIHPMPEDIAEYRAGNLEPAFEQELRTHLGACQECRELLLELAALETSSPMADAEVSEFELEAAWQKQQKRLLPRQRSSFTFFGGWAVAAGLIFVVGILGYEVRELRRTTTDFYAADLPRVIAEERSERTLGDKLPVLEHTEGQGGLVLLLLRDNLPFTSYRAEFLTEQGDSLLIRAGLSSQEDLLTLQIPPGLLPQGTMLVVVSGDQGNGYELIEEYRFRVRRP